MTKQRHTNGSIIVLKKEIKLLFKSKRRVFILVITPLTLLIVGIISGLSFASEANKEPVSVQILDENPTNITQGLKQMISTINNTRVTEITSDFQSVLNLSKFQVFVYIPANFSSLVAMGNSSSVFIYYNTNSSEYLDIAVQIQFVSKVFEGLMIKALYPNVNLNLVTPSLIATEDANSSNEEYQAFIVIVPIYAVLFIIISPLGLILISVTIEREQKTLEVLFLQPVKRSSIIMGKIYYGLFLIFLTLILDVLSAAGAILIFFSVAGDNSNEFTSSISDFLKQLDPSLYIGFFASLFTITLLTISISILLSLLAKDEREANMIAGILPMLIVITMGVLFSVPIEEYSVFAQLLLVGIPIAGVLIAMYLAGLAGAVTWIGIFSIVVQVIWFFLITKLITYLSESESILELSYGKMFKLLKGLMPNLRRKS